MGSSKLTVLEVSFHFVPLVDHLFPRFSLAVPLLFSFSMLSLMHLLVTLTLFTSVAWAVPVPAPGFLDDLGDLLGGKSKSGVAAISAVDLSSAFNRAAQFSRAVYCSTDSVTTLTCGAPCDALGGDVTFLLSGGDGGATPLFFVAHDAPTNSIIVAHQGTDPDNILSVLNDAAFFLEDLSTNLISGLNVNDIKVHSGFQNAFERTAAEIMAAVQDGLTSTGSTKVIVTGHSLGAAIATLDALMFKSALDPSISVTATLFGSPRVGDQAFANFADKALGTSLARITNQADPVPLLPPRFLEFVHASGEVHINSVDANGNAVDAVQCAGQENRDCSDKDNLLQSDVQNHLGPYFDNISFGTAQCA
ncbi:alpha/beta-hydrolase [Mucidula mucida]|nr:alpha/beta-hydrolase [Mucidula mucida]